MMPDSFYVYLLSNTHDGNRIGDFRVQCANPVVLEGQYEVALTHIVYPYNFDVITDKLEENFSPQNSVFDTFEDCRVAEGRVPTKNYESGEELVAMVNYALKTVRLVTDNSAVTDSRLEDAFTFDAMTGRCSVVVEVKKIQPSRKLAYLLGFDHPVLGKGFQEAQHPVHLCQDLMFIYTNIVDYQMISNVMAPLLKMLCMKGKYGHSSEVSFDWPQYVPVLKNEFDTIKIELKNDKDEIINFHSGKVAMTLHFRRKRTFG